jgi:hypothetical protein
VQKGSQTSVPIDLDDIFGSIGMGRSHDREQDFIHFLSPLGIDDESMMKGMAGKGGRFGRSGGLK